MGCDKKRFRRLCLARLQKANALQGKQVAQTLERILQIIKARRVLLFMPMGHEPDIGALLRKRHRFEIFVPFMQGQSFKMVKLRLPLEKKKFNIKEPKNSHYQATVDVAVVPVIGVDGEFRRVGFGKGMYDRFFASLSYRPFVIFVQNRECFTSHVITDSYDVRGDMLVTPRKIVIRGDSYVGRVVGRKLCRDNKRRCRIYRGQKTGKRQI